MRKELLLVFALLFTIGLVSALSVYSQISVTGTQQFTVVYNEFISSPGTSDFNSMSNSELQNMGAMSLENIKGRVEWLNSVDLTSVHENYVIDLDKYIGIGEGDKITLDNAYFTNLVGLVRISFYDMDFVNPRVLRNGIECNDCTLVSYVDGKYVFTTPLSAELNVFELQEQPIIPPSSGGGGGGGSFDKDINFTIEPTSVQVVVYTGESSTQLFKLTNAGNIPLTISFAFPSLAQFIETSPSTFILEKNQFRGVEFTFSSLTPGVYTGQIIASSNKKLTRTVDVVVQVKDRNSQYDLSLNLKRKVLRTYSKLDSSLDIVPSEDNYESGSKLQYKIADFEGNEYPLIEEEIVVKETTQVKKVLVLPKSIDPGNYILYAVLDYGDKSSTSVSNFRVLPNNFWFYLLVLVIIGAGAGAAAIYHDTNLFTFRSFIHGGLEALKTGNLDKARDRYRYMSKYFYLLSQSERKKAMNEGVRYYSELSKKIRKK